MDSFLDFDRACEKYKIREDEFIRKLEAEEITFFESETRHGIFYVYSENDIAKRFKRKSTGRIASVAKFLGAAVAGALVSRSVDETIKLIINEVRYPIKTRDEAKKDRPPHEEDLYDRWVIDVTVPTFGPYYVDGLENVLETTRISVEELASTASIPALDVRRVVHTKQRTPFEGLQARDAQALLRACKTVLIGRSGSVNLVKIIEV